MNKTAIKNFAIWARNKLIADIVYQAGLLGVTEKGIANALPQSTREVQFFDIGTKDYMTVRGNAIRQRDSFVAAIKAKQAETDYVSAFRFVVEKVAYTWFNRLIAIRFMEVNDYLPGRVRVLSSETPGKAEPDMVTRPFDTDMVFSVQEQDEIIRMKDENRLDELFRMLFIKQCQKLSEVLPGLFDPQGIERSDSYLELLLTISFTDKDSVLWHLINDIKEKYFRVRTPEDDERQRENNIPEEEMPAGQIEIIGWMYQYYNTEPKEQVFANIKKNIRVCKDSIPAATQLFTPDWIVHYLVENSLGRLWLEGHPNEGLKKKWKYYLEEAEQSPEVKTQLTQIRNKHTALHPEEIKVIDPSMGSGHILVCLFEVLLQIYESQGWTQREAAQSIVLNNIYGLDIDDRAAQLAYFAIMMKARQYDRRFLERGIVPHVFGIQESNTINQQHIQLFGKGLSNLEKNKAITQLNDLIDTLHNAKEYGSILKLPELDWELLHKYTQEVAESGQIEFASIGAEETLVSVKALVEQSRIMAQKYDAVVTNPPYMTAANMSEKLQRYVRQYYPESKSDLCNVFLEHGLSLLKQYGYQAMITMESWMYLTTSAHFRNTILSKHTISSMIHMPYLGKGGTSLGINFGTQMSSICKAIIPNYVGTYDRIVYTETDEDGIPFEFPTQNTYYQRISQDSFSSIPGSPVAYWIPQKVFDLFQQRKLEECVPAVHGFLSGHDEGVTFLWYEVKWEDITFNTRHLPESGIKGSKYTPLIRGGEYRKWYGNYILVARVDEWAFNYLSDFPEFTLKGRNYYFKEGLSWPLVTSGKFSSKYLPEGYLFGNNGPSIFGNTSDQTFQYLGFMNSCVAEYLLDIINPTMSCSAGVVKKLPIIDAEKWNISLPKQNVEICRADWDSFETSWDFKRHPLVVNPQESRNQVALNLGNDSISLISKRYDAWQHICSERFLQLKSNEEELNRLYRDIYNLQDVLSADVDDAYVTARKADISREIRSLISYAVGCMFGRYSLDVDGIAYAGGCWDIIKYRTFQPDLDNCIPITDEAYFEDDMVGRFVEFIRVVYGTDTLEENLDFIAKALGNKGNTSRNIIRNYFLNSFFNEHTRIYQKRPIYWLFDSGKQNGFKALVYMHRWDADTVGNLRVEYLHRMQRVYEKEIERMQDIMDNSRDNREVNQASKRREKLVKQLKETRDYDTKIAHAALSRVEIDLDDGVKANYEKVQKGPDGKSLGILAKI